MKKLTTISVITSILAVALYALLSEPSQSHAALKVYKQGDAIDRTMLGDGLSKLFEEHKYLYGYESTDQGFLFLFEHKGDRFEKAIAKLAEVVDLDKDYLVFELSTEPLQSTIDDGGEEKAVRHDWRIYHGGFVTDNDSGIRYRKIVLCAYLADSGKIEKLKLPIEYESKLRGTHIDFVVSHNDMRSSKRIRNLDNAQ